MEIYFLGTGSCIPSIKKPNRSFAGLYIQIGDNGFLFDMGPGTLTKMIQSGIDINKKPTHIFFSHLHPDHCADFVGFMQGRGLNRTWNRFNDKVKLFGGEGLNNFVDQIFTGITAWKSFSEELKVQEVVEVKEVLSGETVIGNNWTVKTSSVKHFNSLAFRLDHDGRSIVYSGDMGYDENFSEFGKDADIAIMECSFPDKISLKGTHLYPEDIGKLARIGNFKHVVLTHMYPECEGREDEMIEKIHEFTNAKVTLAHDLLKIQMD